MHSTRYLINFFNEETTCAQATDLAVRFSDENMHTKHFTMPEMWQQKNFHGLDFTVTTLG